MDRSKPFLTASALALYLHFALQLVAGGLLSLSYGPAGAHADAAALHQGGWRLVQAFHYWGSAVLIVHATLHLAAITWAGWYRGSQARAFVAAVGLAGLSLAFQITGNLLPADRHGVESAAIEGSIAARVPGIGPTLKRIALGGNDANVDTVALWYGAHRWLLPVVLLAALALGLGATNRKQARWPIVASAALALALALLVPSPLGSAAEPMDYTAFMAKPSWYTLPAHGLLVWGGWLGAMVLPAAAGLALLLLPALKPKAGLVRGGLLAFGALGLAAALFAGGESASLVGTRNPPPLPQTVISKDKPDAALAAKGRSLFSAQGCNGCHGQDGLQGVSGPSLKDVGRVHPEVEYYVRYVKNPQSVDKGSTMPAYPNIGSEELRALAEFLRFPR